mmetsp:Transcript_117655/g.374876  ORF Transcript_117655/g.374876 Transcript_117655/m.374876 type:complete len:291 (-) Transcript_117655:1912-2784(-)
MAAGCTQQKGVAEASLGRAIHGDAGQAAAVEFRPLHEACLDVLREPEALLPGLGAAPAAAAAVDAAAAVAPQRLLGVEPLGGGVAGAGVDGHRVHREPLRHEGRRPQGRVARKAHEPRRQGPGRPLICSKHPLGTGEARQRCGVEVHEGVEGGAAGVGVLVADQHRYWPDDVVRYAQGPDADQDGAPGTKGQERYFAWGTVGLPQHVAARVEVLAVRAAPQHVAAHGLAAAKAPLLRRARARRHGGAAPAMRGRRLDRRRPGRLHGRRRCCRRRRRCRRRGRLVPVVARA